MYCLCSCSICAPDIFCGTEQDRDRPPRVLSQPLHPEPTSAAWRTVSLQERSIASQDLPTVPACSRLSRGQDSAASWPYPEQRSGENSRSVSERSPSPVTLHFE